MKKLLLLPFLLFISFAYSQTIEIVGKGITHKSNENLTFTRIDEIDSIRVGAVYKGLNLPNPNDVVFTDTDEGPYSNLSVNDIIVKDRTNLYHNVGYFSGLFNTIDSSGINVEVSQPDKVHSFYAFVYRNESDAGFKSFINSQVSFFYQNGQDDAYIYNIPINKASKERKVKVKLVISELDSGPRNMVIDIKAGSVTKHIEEFTYNKGESLLLASYELENVSGNVDNIEVSIYSPVGGGENGDSFVVSSVIADVEIVDKEPGCTLTQGYWKTHSSCKRKGPRRDDTWNKLDNAENTIFFLSGQDYCGVFATKPGKGGKYYILAHQYIAAELNILNGADSSEVIEAFQSATVLLNTYTPEQVNDSKELQAKFVELGKILADYNEGAIGPGHCDDKQEAAVIKSTVDVFPNPVINHVNIRINSGLEEDTKIELFNFSGRRLAVLHDTKINSRKNLVKVNTRKYKKGNYIIVVKHNDRVYSKKIIKI